MLRHLEFVTVFGVLTSLVGLGDESVRANVLQVDLVTGRITLVNESGGPLTLAAYSIKSDDFRLTPTNWNSIAGNYDANSGGQVDPDDNWLIFGAADNDLSEGAIGAAVLSHAQRVDLGLSVWNTSGERDLTFLYMTAENQVVDATNTIQYGLFDTLGADFDLDLDVDGDDFLAWQSGLGKLSPLHSEGDADLDGDVDGDDFLAWQSQFGTASIQGGASGAIVPEPSACALFAAGCVVSVLGAQRTPIMPNPRRRRSR